MAASSAATAATFNLSYTPRSIYGFSGSGSFEIADSALGTDGVLLFEDPHFLAFSFTIGSDVFDLSSAMFPSDTGVLISGGTVTGFFSHDSSPWEYPIRFQTSTAALVLSDCTACPFPNRLSYSPHFVFGSHLGTYAITPAPATVPLSPGFALALTGIAGFAGLRLRMRKKRKAQV